MSKDLAIKEQEAMVPEELRGEFDTKENMEGVTPKFPNIKILHQAQLFEFPDGSKIESFNGIILDTNRVNAWWEESFDLTGGGVPPDCFSLDGIHCSQNSSKPQCELCGTDKSPKCPLNKFQSEVKKDGSAGRGKACKNMKRIHIVLEGQMLPYRLILPPSNLGAIDEYISLLESRGTPYQLVVTKFGLKESQNKDGIKSSIVSLHPASYITDIPQGKRLKKMLVELKPSMREQEIVFEDYKANE